MGAIDNPKDIIAAYKPESRPCTLQIVDGLAHIALGAEHQSGDAILGMFDVFGLADLHDPLDDLGVGQSTIAEDSASRLDRFDNLVRLVACKCESGRRRVDFHCPS